MFQEIQQPKSTAEWDPGLWSQTYLALNLNSTTCQLPGLGEAIVPFLFLFSGLSHWLITLELQKMKEEMYLNGLESCCSANGSRYRCSHYASLDSTPSDVEPSILWQILPFGFSRCVAWVNILGTVLQAVLSSPLPGEAIFRCRCYITIWLITLWVSHQQRLQLTIPLHRSGGKRNLPRKHWGKVRHFTFSRGKWSRKAGS